MPQSDTTFNQASSFLDPNLIWKAIFADREWMFKTGVGGILNACCLVLTGANPIFLPMVLAVIALICGYLLRVIRVKVADQNSLLPGWNNWPELFISGLTWLVIQIAYIAAIALAIILLWLIGITFGAFNLAGTTFNAWALISFVILTALLLLLAFITPFAMVNFAVCEQVSAGFDWKFVFARVKKNAAVFVLAWILSIGVGWLSVVLPAISIVGIFLTPTTVFIAYLFAALAAAQAWGHDDRVTIETTTEPVKQ